MMSPPVIDAGLPVRAFFTTRRGGVSVAPYDSFNVAGHVGDDPEAVRTNRSMLDELAGAPVVHMAQRHGNTVVTVSNPAGLPEADAIVTRSPNLALAVLVADCVPILMHDSGSGAVGAIHAGRAGVALGIVGAAVARLREAGGLRSGKVSAAVGPAICGVCYEVPEEMRAEVAEVIPEAWAETSWGTPSLDLRAAVRVQLEVVGVDEIRVVGPCTFESTDLFSHRRDGLTGRTAGVIRCEPC
jgi:YfiH family protein